MEFWRRRRLWSVIALVGALSPAALGAEDVAADAAAMSTAKGSTAVDIRASVVAAAKPMSLMDRDAYGAAVVRAFEPLLSSANTDAQLNAAITIVEMHTLSTDRSLEGMLKNSSPAVRYWGAKGLGVIIPDLQKVGGAAISNAVNGLLNALKTESSGIVKSQIVNALGKTNDVHTVGQGVDSLAAQLSEGTVDGETLDAAAAALGQLDVAIRASGGVSKADASAAAKSAAWTASFAAQQQVALSEKLTADQSELPEGYSASTLNVVSTAVKVLNDLAGRGTIKGPAGDESPDALQLMVDGLTGTSSTGPGELQKAMPGVAVPPAIKK
jgi:hypothetical protein